MTFQDIVARFDQVEPLACSSLYYEFQNILEYDSKSLLKRIGTFEDIMLYRVAARFQKKGVIESFSNNDDLSNKIWQQVYYHTKEISVEE